MAEQKTTDTEIKSLNIYQRMALATHKIGVVAKNLNVKVTTNSSYKAVSERDILDAVKPIENECGIFSYPIARRILSEEVQERKNQYGTRLELFLRIETIYRFVNVDDPEDYIDMTTYADGIDSGDKATGKAMTYADKYALMKAYKISTGEDPDQEASTTLEGSKKSMTKTQRDFINALPQAWKDNVTQHYGSLELTYDQANTVILKWDEAQAKTKKG